MCIYGIARIAVNDPKNAAPRQVPDVGALRHHRTMTNSAPPGWYPQGNVQRYWNGREWTGDVAPVSQAVAPAQTTVNVAQPRYVSGLSTGANIVHGILTLCTVGLWAPFWWLHWKLSRRRIF